MKIRLLKKQFNKRNDHYGVHLLKSIKQWKKSLRYNPEMLEFIKYCLKFENSITQKLL